MLTIDFDTSQFMNGLNNLDKNARKGSLQILGKMADALLLLSRQEVPHDMGHLQASGHTYPDGEDYVVAYNTTYATYQHEGHRSDGSHVIRNYQKGRKGKYLEDPLKMNIRRWNDIATAEFSNFLKGNI